MEYYYFNKDAYSEPGSAFNAEDSLVRLFLAQLVCWKQAYFRLKTKWNLSYSSDGHIIGLRDNTVEFS